MADPLEFVTTDLPHGRPGLIYEAQIEVTGGTPFYAFEVVGGSLPAGLVLQANGTITGTPLYEIKRTFTVQVTDSVIVDLDGGAPDPDSVTEGDIDGEWPDTVPVATIDGGSI